MPPREKRTHKGSMSIGLKNYKGLISNLKAIQKDSEKVLQKTVFDFKSRAPAWVSAAVTEVYGVSKKEVKDTFDGYSKRNESGKKYIGSAKANGTTIDSVGLIYRGRTLSPLHFKMKPTSPPKKDVPYKITAEFFKGKRVRLKRRTFLLENYNNKGQYLPFIREGEKRYPIMVLRTISLPQMIDNKNVREKINANIDSGLSKRVENHLNQALKKRGE